MLILVGTVKVPNGSPCENFKKLRCSAPSMPTLTGAKPVCERHQLYQPLRSLLPLKQYQQGRASLVSGVRVSTTIGLNVVLLAIETPLTMYHRLSSWCAGIIDNENM